MSEVFSRLRKVRTLLLGVMLVAVVATACGSEESATATPAPTATPEPTATSEPTATPEPTATATAAPTPEGLDRFAEIPGIKPGDDFDWPRTIETSSGEITLDAPPTRIYSLSLGHAEIVAALAGGDVLVATASFFKDPATSASWEEFQDLPDAGSDPEEIISLEPEIVIASAFTSADLVDQLTGLGIHVIRAELEDSALGNVPNILLLGYMLGAEERAIELADEVTDRVRAVQDQLDAEDPERPHVLSAALYSDIWVAGGGSTEGGIIESAGGINAAKEAGIESHQTVSIESIAAMNPDIILLTQPEGSALQFADQLYDEAALANVPAIRDRKVYYADPTFFTTLSHWNVRGIEESAKLFYPQMFGNETFAPFTHP